MCAVLVRSTQTRTRGVWQPSDSAGRPSPWDAGRQRLLLARDPFGTKRLCYSQADGRLAFASELRALERVPWVSTELDLDGLEAYLATNSVPGPMTILRDARKLLPATCDRRR